MKTTITIVDDHTSLIESLVIALSSDQGIVVKGAYNSPNEYLEALKSGHNANVLVVDYSMPEMNGIELCLAAKKLQPTLKCVLLTMHEATELRHRSRRLGIDGYIVKTATIQDIITTIHSVAAGNNSVQDDVGSAAKLLSDRVDLTPSEIEIVRCIVCEEMSTKEAAEHLHRSYHTVEQHRKNIYHKLGIYSIAGLTKYAIEVGICPRAVSTTSEAPSPLSPEHE